jgi:hypothetical protein
MEEGAGEEEKENKTRHYNDYFICCDDRAGGE